MSRSRDEIQAMASERREVAIALKEEQGLTFPMIAAELGISRSRAAQIYRQGMRDRQLKSHLAVVAGVDRHVVRALLDLGITNLDQVHARVAKSDDFDELKRSLLRSSNVGLRKLNRFVQFVRDEIHTCKELDLLRLASLLEIRHPLVSDTIIADSQ